MKPIRWYMDLGLSGNVAIGRVFQLSPGPDEGKGIRKAAPWQACGMLKDWDDTDLGNQHRTQTAAKAAIVAWYLKQIRDASNKPKANCSAHSSFRPGCVMCETANVEKRLTE